MKGEKGKEGTECKNNMKCYHEINYKTTSIIFAQYDSSTRTYCAIMKKIKDREAYRHISQQPAAEFLSDQKSIPYKTDAI